MRGRRLWVVVGVVGVLAVAGIVAGVLVATSGNTKKVSVPKPSLNGHILLKPECSPVHGASWIYPGPARIVSTKYESFAIRYSCKAAARWTKKMVVLKVPYKKTGAATPIPGPAGFHCEAWPDAAGHAYAGGCQKGTKVAFGWNWNVENSRTALVDVDGQYHFEQVGGEDTETIIRPLPHNHYQVKVLNTSGIGYLKGFTWQPPPGWRITGLGAVKGAKCTLSSATNKLTCAGNVKPPSCLCKGDGGTVVIKVALAPHARGTVGARMQITKMTAVPYLIPGTPAAAKRQHQAGL
jgi:hypothetical protein